MIIRISWLYLCFLHKVNFFIGAKIGNHFVIFIELNLWVKKPHQKGYRKLLIYLKFSINSNAMKPLWMWIVSSMTNLWISRITTHWFWWRVTPFKMVCRFQRICYLTLRMPSSRKTNHISRNPLNSLILKWKMLRTSLSIL